MKVLITGGAGFMGSNFIRYALKEHPDWYITNFDKLTYAGNLDNLQDIQKNPRYEFVKGDIADDRFVNDVMRGKNLVVNFAAETHVDRSILDPKTFIQTDVVGTYTLLEASKTHKVGLYVQVSTDEVYGSLLNGKFTEQSPFEPNSPYAASKAAGDHLCRAYTVTYKMPIIITHSVNFYGPYQYPEKVIPLFITNLLEGKKVPLYGDGSNRREWIYMEDYCSGLNTIIKKGSPGETYNISSGHEISNLELTKKLLDLLAKDASSIESVSDRPGHDFRYALDSSKLQKLGWSPSYSFDQGLKQTVDWYIQNERWWKRIKSGAYLEYYKKQYGKT